MKHLIIIAAAVAACITPALADTGPVTWTGFYIGAQAGYGWGHANQPYADGSDSSDFSEMQNAAKQRGAVYGVYTGYNYQTGPIVLGVDADFNVDRINGDDNNDGGDTNGVKHRWNADIRGRLGYVVAGSSLIYAAGGVSFLRANATNLSDTPIEKIGTNWTGWNIGGGIEHNFTGNVVGRLEYKHADYGSKVARFVNSGYAELIKPKINIVQVGIAYKF